MNKNSKRILSVKLIREIDDSPDTSYFGEYSNKATSEYSIDRKHSLDCQINSHAQDETIEKLERARDYITKQTARSYLTEQDDACEILETAMEELAECSCDESGDMNRNEYRYFNPSFNYVRENGTLQDNLTPEDARKYVKQDYERMESLNAGNWRYIGIRAKAEIILDPFGIATTQTISSGGLWGIESDSDASYIEEVERERLSELKSELRAIGFSTRAISKAFQNVERMD